MNNIIPTGLDLFCRQKNTFIDSKVFGICIKVHVFARHQLIYRQQRLLGIIYYKINCHDYKATDQ